MSKAASIAGRCIAVGEGICVRGERLTSSYCASGYFYPPYSAHICDRLRAAGAECRVSRDVAGDLASGEVFGAITSDHAGTGLRPGRDSGLVCLRLTYGAVSRSGIVSPAPSFGGVVIIGRRAEDCAVIAGAVAGRDAGDSLSSDAGLSFEEPGGGVPKGLRIGIVEGSRTALEHAIDCLEAIGAVVSDADMPCLEYVLPSLTVLSAAEEYSGSLRYTGVVYGDRRGESGGIDEMYRNTRDAAFDSGAKSRIMLGSYVLGSGYEKYYKKAMAARKLIASSWNKLTERCDALLLPHGGDGIEGWRPTGKEASALLLPIFLGVSAVAFSGGLLVGKRFSDGKLLDCAAAFRSEC